MSMAIANRYARALAEVVGTAGNYRGVLQELEDFAAVWRESADLAAVFDSPAIALDSKVGLLDRILQRLGTSKTTSNFLRILARNYRLAMLEGIRVAFRQAVNQADADCKLGDDKRRDDRESGELWANHGDPPVELHGRRLRQALP